MIAPNSVHFSTEPHRSVVEAFAKNVAEERADACAVRERREEPPKKPASSA